MKQRINISVSEGEYKMLKMAAAMEHIRSVGTLARKVILDWVEKYDKRKRI